MTIQRKTRIPRKRAKVRSYKSPRCDFATPTGRHLCRKPQKVTWWERSIERLVELDALHGATREVIAKVGRARGMCVVHAKAEAHRRLREFVRERDGGRCVIPHQSMFPCAGAWQPNHGFDRDEKSCTWAEWNVMGGCAAINTWAHFHHDRWNEILRTMWGDALYEERRQIMLRGEPMNVVDVLAKYPPVKKLEEAA